MSAGGKRQKDKRERERAREREREEENAAVFRPETFENRGMKERT